MAVSLTLLSAGTIQSSDLTSRLDLITAWMNYGIVAGDFTTSPSARFLRSRHFYRPEFYGAPAPRVEAVSSDTHYRRTGGDTIERSIHHQDHAYGTAGNDEGWTTIQGGAATFKVLRSSTEIDFFAALHVYEIGGALSGAVAANIESSLAAQVALFVNGSKIAGTTRNIYAATDQSLKFSRKQIGIVASEQLDRGEYSAEIRLRMIYTSTSPRNWKHVFAAARSFVVEVHRC